MIILSGCLFRPYDPFEDKKNPVVETEYFFVQLRYTSVRNDNRTDFAIILELTDLGKEQEVLSIPELVEGLVVEQIGLRIPGFIIGRREISINSPILRKIYIPISIEAIVTMGLSSDKDFRVIHLNSDLSPDLYLFD